jgi:mono/diheme cytochrome c family protein
MRLLPLLGSAVLLLAAGVVSAQGPMSSTPGTGAAAAPPAASPPGTASPPAAGPAGPADSGQFDVEKLFAGTCGWCHSDGGRAQGRGPKLMDSTLTDSEITYRIKNGKQAAMPAFGSSFNDEQIKLIIQYIRNLKPAGAPSR